MSEQTRSSIGCNAIPRLLQVRGQIARSSETKFDLRDYMTPDSDEWVLYRRYHDEPGRKVTKSTVLARLDRAITLARAEQAIRDGE